MITVRPKTNVMFSVSNFTQEATCYIRCYPQQKWKCRLDDKSASLEYKNFSLVIPRSDFEKYFKEVEV